MNTPEIAVPILRITDGQVRATSLQIAEHFGKRHGGVIRAAWKMEAPAEFNAFVDGQQRAG